MLSGLFLKIFIDFNEDIRPHIWSAVKSESVVCAVIELDSLVHIFYAVSAAVCGQNLFALGFGHAASVIHNFKNDILILLITGDGQNRRTGELPVVQTMKDGVLGEGLEQQDGNLISEDSFVNIIYCFKGIRVHHLLNGNVGFCIFQFGCDGCNLLTFV